MTRTQVTTETEVSFGYTVSKDPQKWAVTRGLSSEGLSSILSSPPLSKFTELLSVDSWADIGDLSTILESLLASPLKRKDGVLRSQLLGLLMRDGCIVAPLSGTGRGIRYAYFWSGLDPWIADTAARCDLGSLKAKSRRTIANIWLSTVEGRSRVATRETILNFLRVHLREGPGARWRPGLSSTALDGLKELSAKLSLHQAVVRWRASENPRRDFEALPHSHTWIHWFETYIDEKFLGAITAYERSFRLLTEYIIKDPKQAEPAVFFARQTERRDFFDGLRDGRSVRDLSHMIGILYDFLNWILANNEEFCATNQVTDEVIVRAEYTNPIRVRELDKLRAEAAEVSVRPSQTVQIALPLEYMNEIEAIILQEDMAWPRRFRNNFVTWTNPETRAIEEVFCPVLPYLVLLLLKLPIRHAQARRLDSGEGDEEIYDLASKRWQQNPEPFAGHWINHRVRNPNRGALRKIIDTWNDATLCGFYINSNKTADRKYLFSEDSGYVISWENVDAIDVVLKMRKWQEKYNPLEGPTRYSDLRSGVFEKMSPAAAKRRPDCFYLFRYPCGLTRDWCGSPPSSQQLRMFWYECLAELERRHKARGTTIELVTTWQGNSPQASPYTLHGLRHAGLTRLAMEGVHPWILQNIVAGHAQYVMTLYYIKPSFSHISAHLQERYIAAMCRKQEDMRFFLSTRTLEQAHRIAVARGDEALKEIQRMRRSALKDLSAIMANVERGLCPNGRMRCGEGLRLNDRTENKQRNLRNTYGPVPTTVGGEVDCTRCRFFVTGTPFIDGLIIKTNEVSLAAYKSAQRYQSLLAAIDAMEEELFNKSSNDDDSSIRERQRLAIMKQEVKSEAEVLTNLTESLHSHGEFVQKVRALLRQQADGGDTSLPALLFDEEPKFEWGLVSKFEAIDAMCHSAKWFHSIRADDLKRERRESVVQMLVRENRPPALVILSTAEADAAIDAMTAYLYTKLGRSVANRLFDGAETLEALGIVPDVEHVMSTAIGKPVKLAMQQLATNGDYLALDKDGCSDSSWGRTRV